MNSSIWEKLERLNREGLLPHVLPGYRVNNKIFVCAVLIVLIWLCAAAWPLTLDFKTHMHISCPTTGSQCENPFWRENYVKMGLDPATHCPDAYLCELEFLQPGQSWGQPPNFFYNNAGLFGFAMVALAVAINHFLYNRDYKLPEDKQ